MGSKITYTFSETSLKTPTDKMRANSIVNAPNNETGLSLINFNISTFIARGRHNDAIEILKIWAVHPVNCAPEKFSSHPEAGTQALLTRMHNLLERLTKRTDLSEHFLDNAQTQMHATIQNTIHGLTGYSPSNDVRAHDETGQKSA